jgi:glycosyltransferase involved in cell wall biosynthesis
MTPPLVSVYLPTRNRAALLATAIDSVLAQQHASLELIVVDDDSQDDTSAVLASAAARDRRLRSIRLEPAAGACAARNAALAAARGEFITGLDDDDLMLPERIAALIAAWRDERAFLCSGWLLDRDGWIRPVATRPALIGLGALLAGNVVGNQVLTRTARLREVGGYDRAMVASQDHDLWTRLVIRFGSGERLAAPTLIVRHYAARERLSTPGRAGQGARQYLERYRERMNPAQRRSMELTAIIAARGALTAAEVWRFLQPPTARSLAGYLLRKRLPMLARALDRLRGWRYARRSPPLVHG